MKKINHSYPKTAYICFFIFKNNGKTEIYTAHPEIVNTIEAVKSSVDLFNSTMKKQGSPISIWKTVGITCLELIDVFPYSEKKWNNQSQLIENSKVGRSCYKLRDNDYFEYRVLIAPCKDPKGVQRNTVQSVYRSSSNRINWKTLLHFDNPVVEGTKYIALYKCGPPEIYVTDTGVVAELPPKGSAEEEPKNIRRV